MFYYEDVHFVLFSRLEIKSLGIYLLDCYFSQHHIFSS